MEINECWKNDQNFFTGASNSLLQFGHSPHIWNSSSRIPSYRNHSCICITEVNFRSWVPHIGEGCTNKWILVILIQNRYRLMLNIPNTCTGLLYIQCGKQEQFRTGYFIIGSFSLLWNIYCLEIKKRIMQYFQNVIGCFSPELVNKVKLQDAQVLIQ